MSYMYFELGFYESIQQSNNPSERFIPLIDEYRNMNFFSLSSYYEPYFYNGEWEYDPDHMVFGARDKKSAMKVFIDCYFSQIFQKRGELFPFWKYLLRLYNLKSLIEDVGITWEYITFMDIKGYLESVFEKWDQKIPFWEHIGGHYWARVLKDFFGIEQNSITKECLLDFLTKVFSDWQEKTQLEDYHISDYIIVQYEFGNKLIKDVVKFYGINKDSITVEKIESYLIENAANIINTRTDVFLDTYVGDEFYEVEKYMRSKYPIRYSILYNTPSSKFKKIDSYLEKQRESKNKG